MGKLYVVTFEISNMVVAESEDEARQLAERAFRDTDIYDTECDVMVARYIPPGWDKGCLVYHNGEGDMSVDAAMRQCEHKIPSRVGGMG